MIRVWKTDKTEHIPWNDSARVYTWWDRFPEIFQVRLKKRKKNFYTSSRTVSKFIIMVLYTVLFLLSLFQFLGASKWLPFPSSMVISWASPSGAELPLDFCYFETCHCKNPRTNLNIDYSFNSYKGLELFNYQKPKLR